MHRTLRGRHLPSRDRSRYAEPVLPLTIHNEVVGSNEAEIRPEVRPTVLSEPGHFGMDESQLIDLWSSSHPFYAAP
jgi:hypothetical protein